MLTPCYFRTLDLDISVSVKAQSCKLTYMEHVPSGRVTDVRVGYADSQGVPTGYMI